MSDANDRSVAGESSWIDQIVREGARRILLRDQPSLDGGFRVPRRTSPAAIRRSSKKFRLHVTCGVELFDDAN
ncbi:hypothetical protein [Fodinicola acaciae]|uniref:hypothetical protein n=1 Tax=Fodinicola acaciae TaxID=2681555 RepID=UPI0013D25080|nr:hypothetical protein [Fodinicola acaciae]